jgi:hypothetical protein
MQPDGMIVFLLNEEVFEEVHQILPGIRSKLSGSSILFLYPPT